MPDLITAAEAARRPQRDTVHRSEGESTVAIVRGDRLTSADQRSAIDVLFQGFRRKLRSLLLLTDSTAQIKRVLPEVIDFSQSLVAVCQTTGEVCGVLLMNLGGKDYLNYDWPLARREFGWWGSVYRRVNYWLVNAHRRESGELNIQALAVRRGMRCRGIGAQLIAAAEEHAAVSGYDLVSLEVVDSNPRAKRLYERVGFSQQRTSSTWPFTLRAGFRGYDYMVKRLPR